MHPYSVFESAQYPVQQVSVGLHAWPVLRQAAGGVSQKHPVLPLHDTIVPDVP